MRQRERFVLYFWSNSTDPPPTMRKEARVIHYYCPHCKQVQPIREYFDGTSQIARCQVCENPVEADGVEPPLVRQAKLLLIDDDQLLLGFFRTIARAHEYQPLVAPDGPSGIAMAKLERPDLIIVDAKMGPMDGFEVCRRLRGEAELKDTPILIVTALQDPTLSAQGMKVGATLTLTKSMEHQQFFDTIKTLLTLKSPPSITS